MSIQGKVLRGVSGGAFFSFATIVVLFVQLRLVLDFLPVDIAGTWLLFISIGAYIAFFDLGISPTIAREIGFCLGSKTGDQQYKAERIADLLATSNNLFRLMAIAVFGLSVVIGGYIVHRTIPEMQYAEVAWAWFIFASGAALNLWASSPFAALYGLGYMGSERMIRSLSILLGLALSGIFLYAGFGIIGMATAWTIQGILARLIARRVLHRKYPELLTMHGVSDMQKAKSILIPSIKWAMMGFGAILILQTDNMIIASILGTSAIPAYEAAAKISITAMSLALLLVTATSPQISKAYAEKNHDLVAMLLSQGVRLSVSTAVFFAAFVAVYGDAIIEIWLGSGRFVGFPVLWTLLIMVVLEAHHVAMATATLATGHIVFAKPALIAGLLNLVISIILATQLGLWGVALGTLIAQLLTNNWYAPYVTLKHFGLPFVIHLKTTILPTALLLLILLVTNVALKEMLKGMDEVIMLLCALSASTIVAACVLFLFVLTKYERSTIQKMALKKWEK